MIALITCPALLATNEAIRQGQSKDRKDEHRARRCNLVVSCIAPSGRAREIDHREVVLKNSKVCYNPSFPRCLFASLDFLFKCKRMVFLLLTI